ncbi:MAG: IS1634 family transposase [Thermaerobacter sp.]|nr:IS1634 family transposase [Thermaerobacter sp.]
MRYLQLAENVWDKHKGCAVAKVVYNFGRADQVDEVALRRLAKSITRFLSPEDALRVQAELSEQQLQEMRFVESRPFGGGFLLHELWLKLGIDRVVAGAVREHAFRAPVERAIFTMVANRALAPASKRHAAEWLRQDVALPEIGEIPLQQFYRAMDVLLGMEEQLQRQVFEQVARLFNLEVDLLFFDTTSTYFEVEQEDDLRKFGHGKDHRPDRPQVVIGLAVTRDGIPVRVWTWPGNTADVTRVAVVRQDLRGWRLGRVIQVVDRGFVSEENLKEMTRGGDHYIAGVKLRSGEANIETALSRPGRFHKIRDNIEIKEIIVGEGERRERYILVRNPKEAVRDKMKREDILRVLAEELAAIKELPQGHQRGACELLSHSAYGHYLILEPKTGKVRLNKERIHQEERLDGKYLISTSDDTLTPEDVALGYRQLAEIEADFRSLKQTLELRPVYHRLEDRIRAHVLLCWLALLLIRVAETQTRETWPTIRDTMQRMHLGTFAGASGSLRRRTETRPEQAAILRALEIKEPPIVHQVGLGQ